MNHRVTYVYNRYVLIILLWTATILRETQTKLKLPFFTNNVKSKAKIHIYSISYSMIGQTKTKFTVGCSEITITSTVVVYEFNASYSSALKIDIYERSDSKIH